MQKITMSDLWRLPIGMTIRTEGVAGIYLGKEEWGHVVWTGLWEEMIEEWNDEDEVTVLDIAVDYDELVKIKAGKVVQLAAEGWTLDKDRKYLNLNSELEELEVVVRVRDLVGVESR